MINHGIVTGALFMCVGVIYDRTHSREISYYGGLASTFPLYAAFFMIFTLASIGLPGTNGFIGEFLILLGTYLKNKLIVVFASTGVIIGAAYMLWLYLKVFFLRPRPHLENLSSLKWNEYLAIVPMIFLVFIIGFYPNFLLDFMRGAVAHLLSNLN